MAKEIFNPVNLVALYTRTVNRVFLLQHKIKVVKFKINHYI